MLTILSLERDSQDKVLCECECGTQKRILIYNVRKGNTSSCGCLKKQQMKEKAKQRFSGIKPANYIDYVGRKIGMVTVIKRIQDCRKHTTTYECQCECGTFFPIEISALRRAKYESCRCGPRLHPLRNILQSMIDRCTDTREKAYRYYGAKGIKVCEDWMKYPIHFIQWADQNGWKDTRSSPKKERLSIDRIDSDKDYCPENCHWITLSENSKKAMQKRWKGTYSLDVA